MFTSHINLSRIKVSLKDYKMKALCIAICICCVTLVTLVHGSTIPVPTEFTGNNDCLLHTKPGDCLGFFPRYSYRSGMCKFFVYGGCGGNANNFLDIDECQKACMPAS